MGIPYVETIRTCTGDEVSALSELMACLHRYYEDRNSQTRDRCTEATVPRECVASARDYISAKRAYGFFAGDQLAGYITTKYLGEEHHNFPNSIFISELYVRPEYRRQKVGSKLVKYVLGMEFPKEYTYFSVTHSPAEESLTKFYTDLGFTLQGPLPSGNIAMVAERV